MKNKATDELTQELMGSADIDSYIKKNEALFVDKTVIELLRELYGHKAIPKAALAKQAGMSEVYVHQVFSGRRNPSRDRLLCLCIGLEATLDETQQLLKQAIYAQLYPANKRDAIIIHGIAHHTSLTDINDKLFTKGEKTLF